MVRYSARVPGNQRPNKISRARAALGTPPFDLTESNPTRCELPYPGDLLQDLGREDGLRYRPDPRGPARAREAIAEQYRAGGLEVSRDRIFLTASTSEAYGFLFKLLADPGDCVLVPSPSYPLFDQLARLDGIALLRYGLDPDDEWRPDLGSIADAPPNVRALVVVHPNNPTGSLIRSDDASRLAQICHQRGWALIADEVFLPYTLQEAVGLDRSFAAGDACLGFTLGGFSKSIGLPQAKLGWIVVSGPEGEVARAAERLEYISDAYLSVSGLVAGAAAGLMERGARVRDAILNRCRRNRDALAELSAESPAVSVFDSQGGWSVVVRIPAILDDEDFAVRLLEEQGVAVHPGYLFDFPGDGFLVLSLLPPEDVFAEGVRRLLDFVGLLVEGRG